jgi:hypothetical protein
MKFSGRLGNLREAVYYEEMDRGKHDGEVVANHLVALASAENGDPDRSVRRKTPILGRSNTGIGSNAMAEDPNRKEGDRENLTAS